nr:hypothetical protein [Mycolicibacterium komanii]CRL76637.1 hypothetical protein CPGR_04551 [Mycolicibacterium komanii]
MAGKNAWLATVMAVLGGAALYRGHVRPWIYTWGATEPEITAELPGDELVATDAPRTTRAVTIDAPIDSVWPWLVQIGEDRAGFYSYSVLERAVGARIHNAERIHPEWQDLAVGDTVWLARRYGEAGRQVVAALEPRAYLALVSPEDFERLQRGEKAGGAWIFHLRRTGSWTRLLVRGSGGAVGHALFDVAHFVMEQKMLRGIRDRAHDEAAKGRPEATVHELPCQRIAAPG